MANDKYQQEKFERYSFVCNAGCGVCAVKVAPFEYERTETIEGEHLGSKYQPQIVSSCCGSEVHVYDNDADHWGAEVTIAASGAATREQAVAVPITALHLIEDAAQAHDQCRAVVHMALSLAEVYVARASILAASPNAPVELIGQSSAATMGYLGDLLSNMDAVEEGDEWLDPIFEAAQARWPDATPTAATPAAPGEVTPKVWDCAQCGKPIHGPIVLGETAGAFHPACRTPAPLGERAGFEAAISKAMPDVMPLVRNFDDYQRVGTQMAWWAWQTRAALKGEQPAQRKEGGE
jgi:hypothetical protein